MNDRVVTETFFRPEAMLRRSWRMPVDAYRRCQRLLRHSDRGCVFVPIRSMQFQAVIDRQELIFVDALGGHLVRGGEGGRVILLSWHPAPPAELVSLAEPVPCRVVHYRAGLEEVQRRLVGEFSAALGAAEARLESGLAAAGGRSRIIPLRPPA